MTLQRRTPLKRGTSQLKRSRLYRTSGLASTGMLTRTPMKRCRPKPAVPQVVRAGLWARSLDGWCEIQLPGCWGRATDPAHRIGQGQGGNDDLSNVLYGCRPCHDWCHDHPARAKQLGLMLHPTKDPLQERVKYRGRWALLDNQGGVHYLPTNQRDERP